MSQIEYGHSLDNLHGDLGLNDTDIKLPFPISVPPPQHLRINLHRYAQPGHANKHSESFLSLPVDRLTGERKPEDPNSDENLLKRLRSSIAVTTETIVTEILNDAKRRPVGEPASSDDLLSIIKNREPLVTHLGIYTPLLQTLSFRKSDVSALVVMPVTQNLWGQFTKGMVTEAISARRSPASDLPDTGRADLESLNESNIAYIASFIFELITKGIPKLRTDVTRATLKAALREEPAHETTDV